MRAIGFDETVIFSTWTVLSVILQFGNCAFGSAEEAQMPDAPVLSKLSQALRCDPMMSWATHCTADPTIARLRSGKRADRVRCGPALSAQRESLQLWSAARHQ